MKKRESTGSARKRKEAMTKKTSSLEIKTVNPVIVESELGKDVIDKVTYKMESVQQIEELWGALNHPSTNVMKLLVQMIEEIQPGKYPTEEVMENMGLRMVKVLGLSPEEVKIVALHNFFSIGLQAIPMHTLQIVGEDKPACFTIDESLEKNTVRMFYKQKGMEETEMGMAINVMSMFKFLHGITKANVQIAQMIGEICKVWNIQTEWMGWEFVDEENTDQQQEIMKMLNIQRTTIMARQLRPEIAIRANARKWSVRRHKNITKSVESRLQIQKKESLSRVIILPKTVGRQANRCVSGHFPSNRKSVQMKLTYPDLENSFDQNTSRNKAETKNGTQ